METSLWQVGDMYKQNFCVLKFHWSNIRKKIMDMKLHTFCLEMELIPTDIITMTRIAWNCSVADVQGNEEAMSVQIGIHSPIVSCFTQYYVQLC